MSVSRRAFLRQTVALGLSPFLVSTTGCQRPRTREAILEGLARDVWTKDVQAIRDGSVRLDDAIRRFASSPSEVTLSGARDAWKVALLGWRRGYAGRNGPLVESGTLFRTVFWPARGSAIDEQIDGSAAIDAEHVDELGVDVKGMYGLEYLLFGTDRATGMPSHFTGGRAVRATQLAGVFSGDVRRSADAAATATGDGAAYATKLKTDTQQSITTLVGQAAGATETLVRKLGDLLGYAKSRRLTAREIEGFPSAASTDVLRATAASTERIYFGDGDGGLGALVRAAAPTVDAAIAGRAHALREALASLKGPVEETLRATPEAVERAAAAAKALEICFKAELATALGVTLTWTAGDGD